MHMFRMKVNPKNNLRRVKKVTGFLKKRLILMILALVFLLSVTGIGLAQQLGAPNYLKNKSRLKTSS